MSNFPFPTDNQLSGIAIAYKNPRLIADAVMPKVPVAKKEFRYLKHDLADSFTVPDTKVGRKSVPNEISFQATEESGVTEDYGLDDVIPYDDIANAPAGHSPVDYSTTTLTDLIMLDREIRVAGIVFDPATYAAGKKVTLAGTDQWNDFANSDPVGDIQAGVDALIIRPNTMVIGRDAYSKLVRHPAIVKAIHGPLSDDGLVKRDQLAELFEMDKVLVGEAWLNTAKKGHPEVISRVWGKHCALLWLDPSVRTTMGRATFALTAEFMNRIAGETPEPKIGLRGSTRVRVGESVDELITAADLGFFIEDAVA